MIRYQSLGIMSNEEEKKCPLCAEEMDWTDQQLNPCKCGYQVCVWCWHHIMDMAEKDATEGRCPACRTPYDKDRIVGLEANFQRVAGNNSNRKQKPPKPKAKPNEGRKDLSNVRVIQRRMAYIIGLPLSLADEELLQRKDYFGQYGKVTKVSLSRTAGGTIQQFINDSCSVYITYAKEEEAVRCIQSVHDYVLEGRFLRASFGTAKYCHAWLRNMPCNNPACLYLHTIGAEEDSFGKDEVAAVHTRNRVQEIVGATEYLHKRSGSMLPPPVVEHVNNHSALAEEPVFHSGLKDVAYAAVASGDHLPRSKDKDGPVRSSKQMTSFVDIVGRSCNSGSDKDVNSVEERRILNLCSGMSSVCIDKSNHVKTDSSAMPSKTLAHGQFENGVSRSKLYSESFRETSKLSPVERADFTRNDLSITKEQSGLILDSERQVPHYPCNTTMGDLLTFYDQRLKDSIGFSQTASLIPSYPAKASKNYSDHAWWHTESHNQNDHSADHSSVNSYADESSIQSTCINSVLNDGYNEKIFESSSKSDRIYRSSNSFSNEEIVEHLRRLDGDTLKDNDENSAAVESSIISNILSLDFDGCDGSSWNFQNSYQSKFPFVEEQGFSGQQNELDSHFSNFGQELKSFSVLQDSAENKEFSYKPQYPASRAQNLIPPGFSMPSKTPPGFSSSMKTEQVLPASSGNHFMNTSLPNNHYRSPSLGNLSNSSDDILDPAIMLVGRGKSSTHALNSSWSSSFSSRHSSSFDDETKLWLLMQQQQQQQQQPAPATHHLHDPQFSQSVTQRHHSPQFPLSQDDFYLNSGLVDRHSSSYTRQQYEHLQLAEAQQHDTRSEVERLGFENFLPGYGEYMFQMPRAGDVYGRVFGM